MWRVTAVAPRDAAPAVEEAIGEAEAISNFEVGASLLWRIEALFARRADAVAAGKRVRALGPDVEVAAVPKRDWVAESLKGLPPVRVGRFWLHGAHVQERPPVNAIALRIEAGPAFGTGQHETTRGCLLALEALAKARRFSTPLDLGCGTGVLALAIARLWRVPVTASDIDPVAVRETLANARMNGMAPWIGGVAAAGLAAPALAGRGRFDLIAANILARPLVRLAPDLSRALAPGGSLVLSGLLSKQERQVLAAYLPLGFHLRRRFTLGDWPTLVLRRGR
jgi:ribosomal protein L11 methyltransferase